MNFLNFLRNSTILLRKYLIFNHKKTVLIFLSGYTVFLGLISLFILQLDFDTLSDSLLVLHNPNEIFSDRVKHYAFLLPMILVVSKFLIDPLVFTYILIFSAYAASGYIVYLSTYTITNDKYASLIAMLFFLSSNAVLSSTIILDDNVLPIPFLITSIYVLVVKEREVIAGILFGIALSFHFQTIIFLPILVLFMLAKNNSKQTNTLYKTRSKIMRTGKFLITSQAIYLPLVSYMLIFRSRTDILRGNFKNEQLYFLLEYRSVEEIGNWFINWIKVFFLSVSPFPHTFFSTEDPVKFNYDFNLPSMLGIILVIFTILIIFLIFLVPIIFGKSQYSSSFLFTTFYKVDSFIIITGMLFTFVYEPNNPERWIQIFPFLAINLGMNIAIIRDVLLKNFKMNINLSKLFSHLIVGIISSGKIASILLLIIIGNINVSIPWVLEQNIPVQANRDLIDDILANTEPNTLLIIGPFWTWGIISYFRPNLTIYLNYLPTNDDTLVSSIWDQGVGDPINKNQTIEKIRSFYLTGEKIIVHSSAVKVLKNYFSENNLSLILIY